MHADVVIVGAGLAGLAAAERLYAAGRVVVVLDKARRPGGRCATRRIAPDPAAPWLDTGAQYFTARDAIFLRRLEPLIAAELVVPWNARVGTVPRPGGRAASTTGSPREGSLAEPKTRGLPPSMPDVIHPAPMKSTRWVVRGGMNGLARVLAEPLAAGVQMQMDARVARITPAAGGWDVRSVDGRQWQARQVLIAAPGPQAQDLLGEAFPSALNPEMQDCLCLLVRAVTQAPFDALFGDGKVLAWAAAAASKPGQPAGAEHLWTLHGAPGQGHAADVEDRICAVFAQIMQAPRVDIVDRHYWRFAAPLDTHSAPGAYWDASSGLGLAGDWLNGGRVEGAWMSGWQMAERVLTG